MLFGAAYYPEHRDPARWDHDLDLMAEAGVNALRVGEFAWKRFEPSPGAYDFAWMDRFAAGALARGIRLVLCPPMRTTPAWLVEQDPTILIENEVGARLEFGSRYTFCINHPLLRERGLALAEAMARHYGANPAVVAWHLDNEYGDEPDCHCPLCKAKWQAWLAERYDGIGALNRAWGNVFWGLEYDHFGQVPTPRLTKTCHSPGHIQAWRQFRSDCTVELVGLHAQTLRPHLQEQPITTNVQSLWNFRTDYYDLARHLDICGTNYYPPFGENCRAAAFGLAACRSYKRANFLVHELRCGPHGIIGAAGNTPRPGEVERLTLHTVAHGADGAFYFRWRTCPFGAEQTHGTITDYDGHPTRIYDEVKATGLKLRRVAGLLAGTQVRSEVAVLYDFPTRWFLETPSIWRGPTALHREQCLKLHRVLCGMGVNCDATGRDDDWSAYKVLVVPLLCCIDDAVAERLCRYVEGGGTLLMHPWCGISDPDATIYTGRLHPRLRELLGVDVSEYATAAPGDGCSLVWREQGYAADLFFDLPTLRDATPLAQYGDTWFAGTPALTERRAGAGRALYLASYPEESFYEAFLPRVCEEAGVRRILGNGVPKAVEITERTAEDGRRLIFLLNASAQAQDVPLDRPMEDVWNEETVSGQAVLPPFGVRVLAG